MRMLKTILLILLAPLFFLNCVQNPDDEDNAIVTGKIYENASDQDVDYFSNPVESVQIWIESDMNSSQPYLGPDVYGYTDSTGTYSIPVYLGNTPNDTRLSGYKPVYYCDVRVFALYRGRIFDFGEGITLGRGKPFPLLDIALEWFSSISDTL